MASDFVTANNPAIFSFLNDKGAIPDYVLNSNKITKDEVDGLNKVAFADQASRLYPCHTKEACWESAAHFAGTGNSSETVKANIVKMASHHGITEDVEKVFELFEGEIKAASAPLEKKASESKYALDIDFQGYQGRGVEHYYPINNAAEVVTASDDCTSDYNAGRVPASAMRKIASAITEAAISFNVNPADLTKEVREFGTRNLPDPFAAEHLVNMRKSASSDLSEYLEAIHELQEKSASADAFEAIDLANETAEKIYAIDKKAGVTHYNARQLSPYALLFTGPTIEDLEKAAASIVSINGINVPVEDFLNLKDSDIDVNFSTKSASIIKEAKACTETALTAETCGSASAKLKELSEGTRSVLLNVLANTGW